MKLIRDKYLQIIPLNELEIKGADYDIKYLKEKLEEELNELKQSDFKDIKEYADVFEVLEELALRNNIPILQIMIEKIQKNKDKGRFKNGIFFK